MDTGLASATKPNWNDTHASTRDSQEQWKKWFRTCTSSHAACRVQPGGSAQPFLPDRLIEIATDASGFPRNWRLFCPEGISNALYLTVSHCWGKSKHMRLMKDNYQAFLWGFNESALPRTYRDAFAISIALGFRFIWIDSLCIVQDDAQDWRNQSSLMGSIYTHASGNIAAAWARDGNDGCFHARDTCSVNKTSIEMDINTEHTSEQYLSAIPADAYYDDIVEAPLNMRGWVTQERYLARRQLSFTTRQVYWECSELVASEQFPNGIPENLTNLGPYNQTIPPPGKLSMGFKNQLDLRTAWTALVDSYSECDLTQASDKLIAIAGLAAKFRDRTDDLYLAGHWRKDLKKQLSWSTDFDVRRESFCSRQATYRAPTWSWASMNGPVMSDTSYLFSPEEEQDLSWCFEVLSVSVQSEDSTQLHSFVSAELVLRGFAIWSHDAPVPKKDGNCLFTFGVKTTDYSPLTIITAEIHWDERLPEYIDPAKRSRTQQQRTSKVLFIITYVDLDSKSIHGIMLCKSSSMLNAGAFARVGRFVVFFEEAENLAQSIFEVSEIEDIYLENEDLVRFIHTVSIL
jgi:hypothetical protein